MSITSSLNKESYARYLVDEKGLSVTDAKEKRKLNIKSDTIEYEC